MIDLQDAAKSLVADLIRGDRFDGRDELCEAVDAAAENACIYWHWCADIIGRYENDPRADTESSDEMGARFKPSEYRQAMAAYAYGIARSIIEAEALELMDELEEAKVDLFVALNGLSNRALDGVTARDVRLSADCPHGWAAHDREDDRGACYWVSGQLDGCNAVAMPAAGAWLSYTWEG